MSEEPEKDQAVPETESGEEHVTPPQPQQQQAPAQWSMPEPVFQQTSGYLPQGFLKQIEDAGSTPGGGDLLEIPSIASNTPIAPLGQPAEEPVLEMEDTLIVPDTDEQPPPPAVAAAIPAVEIEPQPDLSEQIIEPPAPVQTAAPAAAKSSGLRTVMIALALIAMLGLLAMFLAFVYLYFIAGTWDTNNF